MISLRSYILQILSLRSLALAGYTSTPKGGQLRKIGFGGSQVHLNAHRRFGGSSKPSSCHCEDVWVSLTDSEAAVQNVHCLSSPIPPLTARHINCHHVFAHTNAQHECRGGCRDAHDTA